MTDGPLIVQSDKTVLLEIDHELAGAARAAIAPFAELERAPEHVHTYRITPLALWNARAAGHDAEQVACLGKLLDRLATCRQDLGDAEIDDLDVVVSALCFADYYVAWFDITM